MKTSRKKYIKPELEELKIDHDISLIMASDGTPPDDPFGTAQETPPEQSPTQQNDFSENPFEK